MSSISSRAAPLLGLLALLWLIEIINTLSGHSFDSLGILPRTLGGLIGIPLAPFLHGGFIHLIANSMPLLVLGFMVMLGGRPRFILVTIFVVIMGGALTWLMARSSYHIGASGLVFGYFGYLIAIGLIERSAKTMLIAAVTAALYGGLIWGILPSVRRISFEGHLFGLIAGITIAWLIVRSGAGKKTE